MNKQSLTFLLTGLRGVVGRCPHCGEGKLFKSYLKQVENCAECGEDIGIIRADDGPAWLTIMLVGHILAPLLLATVPYSNWPNWLSMIIWTAFALFLTLLILPRAKGVFIGIIWRMGIK